MKKAIKSKSPKVSENNDAVIKVMNLLNGLQYTKAKSILFRCLDEIGEQAIVKN